MKPSPLQQVLRKVVRLIKSGLAQLYPAPLQQQPAYIPVRSNQPAKPRQRHQQY